MSKHLKRISATVGLTAAAAMLVPAGTSAMPSSAPKARAGASCAAMPYSDRTQAPPNNGAGVVFRPNGDTFHVWDNDRDRKLIHIYFNYAGVADKWKYVGTPSDGGQGPIKRNVSERYKQICFYIVTESKKYRNSPIVRYTTLP